MAYYFRFGWKSIQKDQNGSCKFISNYRHSENLYEDADELNNRFVILKNAISKQSDIDSYNSGLLNSWPSQKDLLTLCPPTVFHFTYFPYLLYKTLEKALLIYEMGTILP